MKRLISLLFCFVSVNAFAAISGDGLNTNQFLWNSSSGKTSLKSGALLTNTFSRNPTNYITYSDSANEYPFIRVQPTNSGYGPMTMDFCFPIYNSEQNEVIGFGVNLLGGGTLISNAYGGIRFQLEGNYNDASGANKLEAYIQTKTTNGALRRPIFSSINSVSGRLVHLKLGGDTITLQGGDGTNEVAATTFSTIQSNEFHIKSAGPGQNNLVVEPPASGASSLSLGMNGSSGTLILQNAGAATIGQMTVNGVGVLTAFSNPGGGSAGGSISIGTAGDNSAVGLFDVGSSSASVKGVLVRGRASQSGNLFEAQNNSSVILDSISASGILNATNLSVGPGSVITNIVSATAALDFGNILAAASADLTITVQGAKANDGVQLGLPVDPDASLTFNAFVSSANTVTVRAFNVGAIAVDQASKTFRVVVTQF